jgi:alkylated DNA repair dioxygenase AlkB
MNQRSSDLEFIPAWIPAPEADALLSALLAKLPLKQETVFIAGRNVLQPRLSLWMGEPDAAYRYSGRTFVPSEWDDDVLRLKAKVEQAVEHRFNSVLLNLYRNGEDTMGFHSDCEPELGPEPTIASLSLGAARRFLLKPRKKSTGAGGELSLGHGSLLIMRGHSQDDFVHGVPREPKVTGARLNLTFRSVRAAV